MKLAASIVKDSPLDKVWREQNKSGGSISRNKFKLTNDIYHCTRVENLPPLLLNKSVQVMAVGNVSKAAVQISQ